jgi:type VI secretion system protein ImpK
MTQPHSQSRRRENLALIYQEVLTAIVRLRSGRQPVSNPDSFRHFILEAFKTAARQASAVGYDPGDIKSATFAAVAFLDESVLNNRKPAFEDWLKKPLQEELFGTHVAGDVFFENIQHLLSRTSSMDVADLLEIYYLCLLLGFSGRYSASRGDLKQVKDSILEKITRSRGPSAPLAPNSMLPAAEQVKKPRDRWLLVLKIASVGCATLMLGLFAGYKMTLDSAVNELRNTPAQVRR